MTESGEDELTISVGLCAGRHIIGDVAGYVYPADVLSGSYATDRHVLSVYGRRAAEWLCAIVQAAYAEYGHNIDVSVRIYVTGLTPALLALLDAINEAFIYLCQERGDIMISAMHYDRDTGGYILQDVTALCGL